MGARTGELIRLAVELGQRLAVDALSSVAAGGDCGRARGVNKSGASKRREGAEDGGRDKDGVSARRRVLRGARGARGSRRAGRTLLLGRRAAGAGLGLLALGRLGLDHDLVPVLVTHGVGVTAARQRRRR